MSGDKEAISLLARAERSLVMRVKVIGRMCGIGEEGLAELIEDDQTIQLIRRFLKGADEGR